MAQDDWIMGATAAQDAYRPLGNDPWTGLMRGQSDLPLGGVAAPRDETVAFRTASPQVNITEGDISRATEAAMAVSGGGLTFGGVSAKTADLAALTRAQEMAVKGHYPDDIWTSTGWFKGADDKWRFEIPDIGSKWKDTPDQFTNLSPQGTRMHGADPVALGSVFEHPELFKAYPQLSNIDFKPSYLGQSMKGQYVPGHPQFSIDPSITIAPMLPSSARSTTLHELQHGIQDIEGFATGGNTFGLKPGTPAWDIYQERLKAIRTPTPRAELEKSGVLGPEYTYEDYLREHQQTLKNDTLGLDRAAQDYAVQEGYRRLAGEVEARNVQKRLHMTPEEMKDIPPAYSQDVETAKQFVKFRDPNAAEVQISNPIRAYHSSPHDFERFDLSKIGTGEGAQAYGHGLYFADNPAVSDRGGQYWRQFVTKFKDPERTAARYLNASDFDRQAAAQSLRNRIATDEARVAEQGLSGDALAQHQVYTAKQKAVLGTLESDHPIIGPRTYQVDINADPSHFLDWEKPLRDQPYVTQAAPELLYHAQKEARVRASDMPRPERKAELLRWVKDPLQAPGGFAVEPSLMKGSTASQELSDLMRRRDIPGIKYLDEGSRTGQLNPSMFPNHAAYQDALVNSLTNKTHNYVVVNPGIIDIMRKYGLAGAAPAGMGALAAQDQYTGD